MTCLVRRALWAALILQLLPSHARAQDDFYQVGGYVKYLFSSSDLPSIGRVNDHLLHARLNTRLYFSRAVTAAAEIRNRIFYGGSVREIPDFLSTVRSDHDFGRADIVWWNARSSLGYTELDRLWIDGVYDNLQVTIGRQRIAWGTALVWNPTDLFNPLSVLDFDYEERPGVDAVHVQYFLSPVSKIEIAFKPGKTLARRIVAGKILLNRWNYDLHLIGGVQGTNPFVGGAWAGDIAGAGFRGEILARSIGEETDPRFDGAWSTSASLSADYTFPSNTYIHAEALFNSRGVTEQAQLFLPESRSLGLLSPARWSLFQEVSFDLHPLVRVSGFIIYNPSDASFVVVPTVTWSASSQIDVSFVGLLFSGGTLTEYGGYGQSLFVRGKYSF